MFGQSDGVWRPAQATACLAAFLVTACSATSGGGGGVFVSLGDAAGDGKLSTDATPTTGDAIVGADGAGGTDAAAVDTNLSDLFQPADAVAQDSVPPIDTPVATDTAPGLDSVTPADTGGAACKSDIACKASNQVCNLASGLCVDCNSKSDCSGAQVCVANQCTVQKLCTSSKDCTFVCNKATGLCVECVSDIDCDANKWCGGDFACHADVCGAGSGKCSNNSFFACMPNGSAYASAGQACSSGSACGAGVCLASGCSFTNGGSCNDGNSCTSNEVCKNGVCQGGTPTSCSDNNPCTADSCVNGPGCQHTAVSCDDANACTTDSCNANATGPDPCVHTPIANCGTGACGADPTNTCKGVCATDMMCQSMLCQVQPTFCRPDWAACCAGP